MARMLGRSKSLRILRGGHKETHPPETDKLTPLPTLLQADSGRLRAATPTPVSKADGSLETPEVPRRPTTSSGGPGDRGKLFHRKVAAATPCSPDQAFELSLPSPAKPTATTILYTASVHENKDVEEGVIGIALGSPTMATHWNSPSQPTEGITASNAPYNASYSASYHSFPPAAPTVDTYYDVPKPKLSRWKSLFRKAAPPRQEKASFYQVAQPAQATQPAQVASPSAHPGGDYEYESFNVRKMISSQEEGIPAPAFNPDIRTSRRLPQDHCPAEYALERTPPQLPVGASSNAPAKESPEASMETRPRRALTTIAPSSGRPKVSIPRSVSSARYAPKKTRHDWNDSPTLPQVMVSSGARVASPQSTASGVEKPLLDVAIPNVHMERYSVMFSSLLEPNPASSSASLLARRQGNVDKLRLRNEPSIKGENRLLGEPLKPHRRATSPTPSAQKSPGSLSLFPTARAPSPAKITMNRPRPVQRSRTAPAVSPSHQAFPTSVRPEDGPKQTPRDRKQADVKADVKAGPGIGNRLLTRSNSSGISDDADSDSDSDSGEITIAVARDVSDRSWQPRMQDGEPEWEIVSKPVAITKASALSSHPSWAPLEQPRPRTDQSNQSPTHLSPSPRSSHPIASKPQQEGVATVGIARSVSVSRATRPSLRRPDMEKRAADDAERFMEGKPLTPTLVELKNRKSQRVQLVEA